MSGGAIVTGAARGIGQAVGLRLATAYALVAEAQPRSDGIDVIVPSAGIGGPASSLDIGAGRAKLQLIEGFATLESAERFTRLLIACYRGKRFTDSCADEA